MNSVAMYSLYYNKSLRKPNILIEIAGNVIFFSFLLMKMTNVNIKIVANDVSALFRYKLDSNP